MRRQPDDCLVLLAGDERPTYRPFPGEPASYALPLDLVFVRAPTGLCVTLVGGGRGYPSDHLGVEVPLRWGAA